MLADDAARLAANGDVRHSLMFDATWIAPAQIDTRRCGQIHRETRHEEVIVGRHGALDAFPPWRGVFPHAQTCLRCMLHEQIADHHLQRSRSRERTETLGQSDHLAEPVTASVTGHQVLLNGFFSRRGQCGEPVVHENRRLNGIRTVDVAAAVRSGHSVAPMQARSCWMARWRMTRTLASEIPRAPAVSAAVCSS